MVWNLKSLFHWQELSKGQKDKLKTLAKIYELRDPFENTKICYKNEFVALERALKVYYPVVYQHLKLVGVPIIWYFYDHLTSFYAELLPSDSLYRLWDQIFLSSRFDQWNPRKYLIAVSILLVDLNQTEITQIFDPLDIKNLLFSTPSVRLQEFAPFALLSRLTSIVNRVFKKQDKANKMQSEREQFDEKMLNYQNKNPNELEVLEDAAVRDSYRPSQVDSGSSALEIIILGILNLQESDDSKEFKVTAACPQSSNSRE